MEPPKRGFAMVPHRLTYDKTISGTSTKVYTALHSFSRTSKGARRVKGVRIRDIAEMLDVSDRTFERSLAELESGHYIRRLSKQSCVFEVEFLPEDGENSDKDDRVTLTNLSESKPRLRHQRQSQGRDSDRDVRPLCQPCQSQGDPLPISVLNKVNKESLNTDSPIKNAGGGATESHPDQIAAWVYERILKSFPGDECLAETASLQAAAWVRDEGHSPDQIKATLVEVIGKGIRPIGLMSYTHKVIGSNRARAKAEAASPPPAAFTSGSSPGFQHKNKAQRNSERSERRKAAIMQMFPVPPKEDHLEES